MNMLVRIGLLSCFLGTAAIAQAEEENPLIDRLNELAAMPLDELKANIHEVMPIIKALNGATSEGNLRGRALRLCDFCCGYSSWAKLRIVSPPQNS